MAESLASIDFADVEPGLAEPQGELVTACEYFRVEKWTLRAPRVATAPGEFAIFTCLTGAVTCVGLTFKPGDFFLVPAVLSSVLIEGTTPDAAILRTTIPG